MPRLVACACANAPMQRARKRLVPLARGRVLELGVGAGPNLALYDRAQVEQVVAVEPSALLRARAARAPAEVPVEIHDARAEALPFGARSFDTVVCTFTLCTLSDPLAALAEARRVLRANGRLLYCEHGLAPDADVRRWQHWLEPVWTKLSGNCHLTRDVTRLLEQRDFTVDELGARYLRRTPRWVGWIRWGSAQ